jgi:hypothetical protein
MRESIRDAFRQFARNGRWGTCAGCPRDTEGRAYPEFCADINRHDHQLDVDKLAFQAKRDLAPPPPARRGEAVTLDELMALIDAYSNASVHVRLEARQRARAAIESYARAQRRAALEEAAKKCREVSRRLEANGDTGPAWGADDCEKAVRALAGEEAAR